MRFSSFFVCLAFLAFSYSPTTLHAQSDLMLFQAKDNWHRNVVNPAFFPENRKFMLGLPSLGLDFSYSGGISIGDGLSNTNGQNTFSISKILDKLEAENTAYADVRYETLSLGFALPKGLKLSLGHAIRGHASVTYPKTLLQMLWSGNAQFIGQTVDIGPELQLAYLNELHLGLAKDFGSLTVGAKFKSLNGIANLQTDRHLISVFTDPDIYQLTFATDYSFQSASILSAIDTSDLGFEVVTGDLDFALFQKNKGFAVDLGATYPVNEKLSLAASLLDLGGKVTWKEGATFASKGQYTYEGLNLPGSDFINSGDSVQFDSGLDTLNDVFQFRKEVGAYSTTLPMRTYLGATYQLNPKWRFHGTLYLEGSKFHRQTALGLQATWSPLRWIDISGMYSFNRESAANLGFGLALNPGPVQMYLFTDRIQTVFNPISKPDVNLRCGISLVFGKKRELDAPVEN